MKTLTVLFALALSLAAHAADYGVKTRFQKDKPLVYPDCELTFTGTWRQDSPMFPRGFLCYDFKARSGGKTNTVTWSAGTGLVEPKFFRVNGLDFVLELKGSRSFKGWMKDNELVLWKEADFAKIKP